MRWQNKKVGKPPANYTWKINGWNTINMEVASSDDFPFQVAG